MTIEIIDTLYNGEAKYDQVTSLDGIDFRLTFLWNARDSHWYLTIRTVDDEEITGCEGVKLVQGGWPIRRVYDPNRPAGELLVYSELETEPGLEDLGFSTDLMYIPAADMLEIKSG